MLAVTNLIGFGARRLVAAAATPVVWNSADKTANCTLSNGNRTATAGANGQGVRGDIGKASGKWYFEIVQGAKPWGNSTSTYAHGLATSAFTLGSQTGSAANSAGVRQDMGLYRLNNGTAVTANPDAGTIFSAGAVLMVAADLSAGYVWFGVDGTWGGVGGVTGVPESGTAPSLSGLSGTYFPCASPGTNGGICTISASAAHCTYTPPSGFSYWSA